MNYGSQVNLKNRNNFGMSNEWREWGAKILQLKWLFCNKYKKIWKKYQGRQFNKSAAEQVAEMTK
jgi:hypothetical protein